MRVVHLLRKYNPAEWGGTETAIERLFDGLQPAVTPIIYCPRADSRSAQNARDPLAERGYPIRRFRACVPIWGIPMRDRCQMISVGGNLLSFHLVGALWRERDIELIHSHTMGRLGGTALTIAKRRRLPYVLTIHGGLLDLPERLRNQMKTPACGGFEWGKVFGALFNARRVVPDADAILTCNEREASLLRDKYPEKRVRVQSHGVPMTLFQANHGNTALAAFPQVRDKQLLLIAGRVDPVKNQLWVVERMPAILMKYPHAMLVIAGACTDAEYGTRLEARIRELGLKENVLLAGAFSPGEPRLIGLMQAACALVLPSISETFGLVILEAWAAKTPVISSRTSGGAGLIEHGHNGWLFDLENPQAFHDAVHGVLTDPELAARSARNGHDLARKFDTRVIASQVRELYEELIAEKKCAT
ncbi:MAG: glycosyltransferase family 4 protein [Verrucomicrobia subdivision 3 bacterium]|nr:glycosyltransferase family 4 protein [Limisphaerales bacterium]